MIHINAKCYLMFLNQPRGHGVSYSLTDFSVHINLTGTHDVSCLELCD